MILARLLAASALLQQALCTSIDRDGQNDLRLMQMKAVPEQTNSSVYRFAWLISGQVSRFIYKDSTSRLDPGGLSNLVGCHPGNRDNCQATLDVHIALANTRGKQFRGPGYVLPTYLDGAYEEAAVREHYKTLRLRSSMERCARELKGAFLKQGASEVTLKIISDEQFNTDIATVRQLILKRAPSDISTSQEYWDKLYRKVPRHEMRFETNGNMMYLRHLAYASALKFEETLPYRYTHILYTREDNVWVHPKYTLAALAKQMDGGASPGFGPRAVMVDKHCGWHAYSDKMYFATRSGFDILFARTLEDHTKMMAHWLNRGLGLPKRFRDPLQSEEFFKVLLDEAKAMVTKWDFSRTEARYMENNTTQQPVLCCPDIYYVCTNSQVFAKCPTH